MKKNPVKWMLIVLIVLVVASIVISLFWNKKVNLATGEVGYFGTEPKEGRLMTLTSPTTELPTETEITG